MTERTAIDAFREGHRARPLTTTATATGLGATLALVAPLLFDAVSGGHERAEEAHAKHLETLGAELVKCQEARQRAEDLVLQCLGGE